MATKQESFDLRHVLVIVMLSVFALMFKVQPTTVYARGNNDNDNDNDNDGEDQSCDTSYPDVCIPSPPPDLNCGDITDKNFKVVSPDPHGFDREVDGIGCETYS